MRSNGWIGRLANEPRIRHAADRRRDERVAKRHASRRSRVLAGLRCAVALDIEGFLDAVDDQPRSALTCHNSRSAEGFVVSRTGDFIGTRRLAVDLEADALICRYEIGDRARGTAVEQWTLAVDVGKDGASLSLRNGDRVRSFGTVDALSAFLLKPILG